MSVVSRVAILGVGDRRGARLWVLLRKALVDPLALGRGGKLGSLLSALTENKRNDYNLIKSKSCSYLLIYKCYVVTVLNKKSLASNSPKLAVVPSSSVLHV